MIKIRCPNCWNRSEYDIDEIPVEVRCKRCDTLLTIKPSYVPKRARLELAA